MPKTNLKHRIEELERLQFVPCPSYSVQFDEDALTIYASVAYLTGRVKPDYQDVEPTVIYARGKALRDALYGPIIPVHLDPYIQRYTRASGEFEFTFGREPIEGDMLRYEHVAQMHSPEVYSRHIGGLVEAWQRQLPHPPCPLKFEDGRLFRQLLPESRGEEGKWEEDLTTRPEYRWLAIPQVNANSYVAPESEPNMMIMTISALVFTGVVAAKHQCRPATAEELQRAETESPVKAPAFFKYGWQRFSEVLVEVMGLESLFKQFLRDKFSAAGSFPW